jgi:phospholipase C
MKRTTHAPLAGFLAATAAALLSVGCGQDPTLDEAPATQESALRSSAIQHVFVVMMENQNAKDVYGSSKAPYTNQLMKEYASASDFGDVLAASIPSEPHYVWLEAGTNAFADRTFTSDADASSSNSTASTAHLANQLDAAGLSWMAYQEGVNSSTGSCPISSSWLSQYAAKHNPFVFFRDVSGSPPSKSSARCVSHTRSIDQLRTELQPDHSQSLSRYARRNRLSPGFCRRCWRFLAQRIPARAHQLCERQPRRDLPHLG